MDLQQIGVTSSTGQPFPLQGVKCPIPGGQGQAHEMYLPPGMEDLEPPLVTSGLHADLILPLLNTLYT